MDRRPLGHTGLAVTPIGLGAFKIGRNEGIKYANGYALPDAAEAERIVHAVLDAGINYIDTAPAYGLSEERIGRALGGRREGVVVSTKAGEVFEAGTSRYDFSAAALRQSVRESARRLRTDVLDLVFLHAHQADLMILDETESVDTLRAMKEEGLIRAIGFSGKSTAAARRALAWADVVMVEYHVDDRSHADVIAEAAHAGIGVVVKKGLASGRLDAATATAFVLGTPGVNSLVIGSLSIDHIRENIRYAAAART
jgi:aryl-alcohol dehydrogenase-like predicted oxidoreductase